MNVCVGFVFVAVGGGVIVVVTVSDAERVCSLLPLAVCEDSSDSVSEGLVVVERETVDDRDTVAVPDCVGVPECDIVTVGVPVVDRESEPVNSAVSEFV